MYQNLHHLLNLGVRNLLHLQNLQSYLLHHYYIDHNLHLHLRQ